MKNKDEISNELYKLALQTIVEKISP
jgi:hypothetical protein